MRRDRPYESLAALIASVGDNVGPSEWLTIDQSRIDRFAAVTEDHQWIHVDPVRAAAGPFGTTIAHGYLTLSLLAPVVTALFHVDGVSSIVNYGLNKVRFPAPVRVGSRVRGSIVILDAVESGPRVQTTLRVTISVEDQERPGCVAESVLLLTPSG